VPAILAAAGYKVLRRHGRETEPLRRVPGKDLYELVSIEPLRSKGF
jgi:hypothetical protein